MAIKTKTGKYACSFCGILYNSDTEADTCRINHQLIYIPFTREGLNSLINFLYTKNEKDLDPKMVDTILKFRTFRQPE